MFWNWTDECSTLERDNNAGCHAVQTKQYMLPIMLNKFMYASIDSKQERYPAGSIDVRAHSSEVRRQLMAALSTPVAGRAMISYIK